MPRTFEKDATLRVHQLRVTRAEAEETGIEKIGVLQHSFGADVVWRAQVTGFHTCLQQLLIGKESD